MKEGVLEKGFMMAGSGMGFWRGIGGVLREGEGILGGGEGNFEEEGSACCSCCCLGLLTPLPFVVFLGFCEGFAGGCGCGGDC